MQRFQQEVQAGLAERGQQEKFDLYQAYSDGRLDASEGTNTWSDKTGNCRLAFVDSLMRNQLDSPVMAERFTRECHAAITDPSKGLQPILTIAGGKLDVKTAVASGEAGSSPLESARGAVARAEEAFATSLAPLTSEQIAFLRAHLYDVTTAQMEGTAAYFRDKPTGRQLCDLLEKMDRRSLIEAGLHIASLVDCDLLSSLQQIESDGGAKDGVLIGSSADDSYTLDELHDVRLLVDPGGNDTYLEGTLASNRTVLAVIDLGGNDTYRGSKPGIQGGAIMGVSMVIDAAGDDSYEGMDVAQGACIAGVGILIDIEGNDTYRGLRRNQGSAFGGIAIHIDRAGNDSYHSALYAQGFGGPLGFGILDDLSGNDHYYAGGKWLDGYEDTRGYDGWSQGVGAGPRGVANGGVGVLLDGGGDDTYEYDYFSHGGGYWFAAGFARDFGGHDRRLGATRLDHDGNERGEPVFLRWGVGWQAHYGLGFVFDDTGDDTYGGDIVGLGFSWDFGVAGLFDFAGDDHYQLTYGAQGQQAGYGMLYDVGGDDRYDGTDFGGAPASISYHPLPDCGGNFAFAVNYEGHDMYGEEDLNNQVLERGSPGGFLIDRDELP